MDTVLKTTDNQEIILQTNDLTKNYHNQRALDNVNMTIFKGDIYGFVGENGAGKTTVIRVITNLIKLTSGSYSLFGYDNKNSKIKGARKKIAAIVEGPSIYMNMNAYDNIIYQAKLMNIKDFSKVDEVLEIVGLSDLKGNKKHVKDFSLGMRQRMGIAIALLSDPLFLILDEPMNGLDPEGILDMRNLLLELNKEGITILISSHILSELEKVASRYGFIHKGKIVKEATKEEILSSLEKCLELEVNDTALAKKVLSEYTVKSKDNRIRIYGEAKVSDIVLALANKGVVVTSTKTIEQSIETYYMNIIGGRHNA